jgi:hypothetical protein
MNTGEIILNIGLAVGASAVVAAGMLFVPNHDRLGFIQRFRSVALEGLAQGTAATRVAIAGPSDDQLLSADSGVELSLAE